MAAMFAWPSLLKTHTSGLALTFILPATNCDLNCSFCAIKQREEAYDTRLSVDDYVYFLREVVNHRGTAIMAIQGYEPLLEDSWPYTRALLKEGRDLGIPTSIITNGSRLEAMCQELCELDPTGVTISLDSCGAKSHDKLRGKQGAFEATVAGIKSLTGVGGFAERVTVSSVLMPRKRHLLEGMPVLLNSLGVSHWVVAPLFRMNGDDIGGPVGSPKDIISDLSALSNIAAVHDVSLVLDDELRAIPQDEFAYTDLLVRRFERPDGLVRLVPSGACSVGTEILRPVNSQTPVWHPSKMTPRQFIDSIVGQDLLSHDLRLAA